MATRDYYEILGVERTIDAAGLKCLTRGILKLSGFSVRSTIIGGVEGYAEHRKVWLTMVEAMGVHAV
jgi:hypothetical protein